MQNGTWSSEARALSPSARMATGLREQLREYKDLLDDGTITAAEHSRLRAQALASCQSSDASQATPRTQHKRKRRGRRARNEDEASEDNADNIEEAGVENASKRSNTEARVLLPVPQQGLGGNDVGDVLGGLIAQRRRPWHLRDDVATVDPSFDKVETKAWLENEHAQLNFAQRFAIPEEDEGELRACGDDTAFLEKNYTSCLLHALTSMNRTTCAEVSRTNLCNGVLTPQHGSDRKANLLFDGGPDGGLCGLADVMLWKIDDSDDMISYDPELLQLAAYIAEGSRTGNDVTLLYSAISTRFTAPRMQQGLTKGKVQDGCRYISATNLEEKRKRMPFNVIDDVDTEMLDRVAEYRGGREFAVPLEREVNIPGHMAVDTEDSELEVECHGLFDIMLYKDVLRGHDCTNSKRMIKIDALYIRARFPACDPLIAISHIAKTNTLCNEALMNTLNHMNSVLEGDNTRPLSQDSVFNTSTLRAAELCCEALLPQAVFNFAESRHIFGVHLGGMRMNVHDEEERQVWREYRNGVVEARAAHYRKVLQRVNLDLAAHGIRNANEPSEFRLDNYVGVHYRSFDKAKLLEKIEAHVTACNNDTALAHDLNLWMNSQLQDESRVYFADGRALPRNTGLWIHINADAFVPYCNTKRTADVFASRLLQPAQEFPLARIFLMNRSEPLDDPLKIAWDSDFVPDIDFMQKHMNKLPDELLVIVEEMSDVVTSTRLQEIKNQDVRAEELMQLYGQTSHRIRRVLANIRSFSPISNMAPAQHAALLSSLKNVLVTMMTGDLKHWSMAARTMVDLKMSGPRNAREYVEQYRPFLLQMQQCRNVGLDETNTSALYYADCENVLQFDISYQNQMTIEMLQRHITANFCFQAHAWGFPIRIADMACSCDVVTHKETFSKVGRQRTINMKTMGAGADSAVDHFSEQNNAYGRFLTGDVKVRAFYMSSEARDVTNAKMSGLSLQTVRGSGLPMNGHSVDLSGSSHRLEAGTVIYRTEHNKHQTAAQSSREFMADLETNIADSGGAEGTQRIGWISTKAMQVCSWKRMYSAPISLIAGNRQDEELPESTFGGGRMVSIASAVPDGRQGSLQQQQSNISSNSGSAWDDMQRLEIDQRPPMRKITEQLVHNNMRFFLLRHLMRKTLPFTHRTMTIGVVMMKYNLLSDFAGMGNAIGAITQNLRRRYLEGTTELVRNMDGPWQGVCAFSTFVLQVLEWCTARAVRNVLLNEQDGTLIVDLYGAFQDAIIAMHTVPMTLTAKLSSLHLWLHTTVLDISSMVLFSYVLFSMDFGNRWCSLQTIARVMRGLPLSDEQQKSYDRLCDFLIPLCVTRSGNPAFGRQTGATNVRHGLLTMPSTEQLISWFDWKEDNGANHQSILAAAAERVQGNKVMRSTYVKSMSILITSTKPTWLQKRTNDTLCSFKTGTAERVAAQAFADQQTEEAYTARGKLPNARVLRDRDRLHDFWEAAHTGVRLPKGGSKAQDSNQLMHDPVWQTGFWFDQTVKLVGPMQNLMRHFFILCGLESNVTHSDFFERLLRDHLNRKAPQDETWNILTSLEWAKPALNGDVFKFIAQPSVNQTHNVVEGIETGLSVKLLALVVIQALVAKDWQDKIQVHLRSMGQMSLEIISLLLHTRMEKACVPANHGDIPLMTRSPIHGSLKAATLWYDESLHVDSKQNAQNVLCLAARRERHWDFFDIGESTVLMSNSLRRQMDCDPKTMGDVFPFPPESVMHMPAHFMTMRTVYRRAWTGATFGNNLHIGMREYGTSVTSEMVQHIPSLLTHCMQQREIPCVTFREGWMFVLKCDEGTVRIVPVADDKFCNTDFRALPLTDANSTFAAHQLGDVMARGLRSYETDDGLQVEIRLRSQTPGSPFYFYPCIMWNHLVVFSPGAHLMKADVGNLSLSVQLFDVSTSQDRQDPDEVGDDWWCENIDVPRISGVRIFELSTGWFVQFDNGVMFCQQRCELVSTCLRCLETDIAMWVQKTTGILDADGFVLPIFVDAQGRKFCKRYDYNETEHLRLLQEYKDEKTFLESNRQFLQQNRGQNNPQVAAAERLINERTARLARIQRQLQSGSLCQLKDTMFLCELGFRDVLPPDANTAAQDLMLGTTKAFLDGSFMEDGMYCVDIICDNCSTMQKREVTMDFITLSQSILPEGSSLYLRLTPCVYRDFEALGLEVANAAIHSELSQQRAEFWLQVWYVLGGTEVAPHVAVKLDNENNSSHHPIVLLKIKVLDNNTQLLLPALGKEMMKRVTVLVKKTLREDGCNNGRLVWRV